MINQATDLQDAQDLTLCPKTAGQIPAVATRQKTLRSRHKIAAAFEWLRSAIPWTFPAQGRPLSGRRGRTLPSEAPA